MLYKNLITLALIAFTSSAYTASLHERHSDPNPTAQDVKGEISIASRDVIDLESANILSAQLGSTQLPVEEIKLTSIDESSSLPKANQAINESHSRNNLKRQAPSPKDPIKSNDMVYSGKVSPKEITDAINVLGLKDSENSASPTGVAGVRASTPSMSNSTTGKDGKNGANASDASKPMKIMGGEGKNGESKTSDAASVGSISALLTLALMVSTAHYGW